MRTISCIAIFASIFTLYACSKSPKSASQTKMVAACSSDPYLVKYNCSVDRVQQLATQGDPDAQYALGYMYYYGVSTIRDEDNARLWISRAAAQGQPLAKKAMAMLNEDQASIKHNDSLIKSTIAEVRSVSTKIKKPRVRTTHRRIIAKHKPAPIIKQTPQPKPMIAVVAKKSVIAKQKPAIIKSTLAAVKTPAKAPTVKTTPRSTAMAEMEDDLMNYPTKGYVLQLMGNHHLSVIRNFVKRHHLEDQTHYYLASFHNSPWYMLVYGKYDTVSEANAAIKTLPKELKHMQPWIKPVRAIKAEIKTRNLVS